MASELEKENARLRGELAQVKAQLDRLQNPEEVTLNLLASKMQTLMDSQTVQLEGKLNALLGDAGARAPPPSALPLAEVMHDMEDLGMTEAQVQRAHEIFDMYDDDCSGSIDNDEMMSILRLLGENPTYDEVEAMIAEVDENQNGDLTLNEFLVIYARTEQAQQEADAKLGPESPTKGRSRRAMRSMNDMSFYGVGALMRWVKVDGDEFGGDVTHHPGIPCHRRTARQMAMNKGVESVFYLCICLSALNSGLQTYPEFEKSSPVVMLGHFTNFMFAVECTLKIVADSGSCASIQGYFMDPWNSFDIFVLCALLILTPLTASGTGVGAVRVLRILRLLRALRILRAAKVFPQLTLVLETLIRSTWSVIYILLFLMMISCAH